MSPSRAQGSLFSVPLMSLSPKIIQHPLSLSLPQSHNELPINWTWRIPKCFQLQKIKYQSLSCNRLHSQRLRSVNDQSDAYGFPNSHESSLGQEGLMESNKANKETCTSSEMLKKLKRYGISGILSYGILNSIYYLTTFLLVWFYVAPAPGKMGYFAAVERFLKVMAMVWAGSQVTKLARAAGALALAPLVDGGLSWFTVKFGFKSQGKAFMVIVVLCFGLAFILFMAVTLLWA